MGNQVYAYLYISLHPPFQKRTADVWFPIERPNKRSYAALLSRCGLIFPLSLQILRKIVFVVKKYYEIFGGLA